MKTALWFSKMLVAIALLVVIAATGGLNGANLGVGCGIYWSVISLPPRLTP